MEYLNIQYYDWSFILIDMSDDNCVLVASTIRYVRLIDLFLAYEYLRRYAL